MAPKLADPIFRTIPNDWNRCPPAWFCSSLENGRTGYRIFTGWLTNT